MTLNEVKKLEAMGFEIITNMKNGISVHQAVFKPKENSGISIAPAFDISKFSNADELLEAYKKYMIDMKLNNQAVNADYIHQSFKNLDNYILAVESIDNEKSSSSMLCKEFLNLRLYIRILIPMKGNIGSTACQEQMLTMLNMTEDEVWKRAEEKYDRR